MKNNYLYVIVSFLLLTSFNQVKAQVDEVHFSENNTTITFDGVLYNFPNPGQSTWFYEIDNTDGKKDVSHSTLAVSTCITPGLFADGGTYTSMDLGGMTFNKSLFSLGSDPSTNTDYGLKYDKQLNSGNELGIFFVFNELFDTGQVVAVIKPGRDNFRDSILGPNINCDAVPVELMYFHETQSEPHPVIEWATASEVNNEGFYIERSENGKDFSSIGFVSSHHNSNQVRTYTFTDWNNSWGYYRLRIVDFDGYTEYSDMIAAGKMMDLPSQINVYPSRTHSKVNVELEDRTIVDLRIYDQMGRSYEVNAGSYAGTNRASIDLSGLHTGWYYIQINGNEVKKVLKVQ